MARFARVVFWTLLGVGPLLALRALRRPHYDLHGRTVLVTGGSRGLGLVLARHFADAGARVAICGRDQETLERARADLEARGAQVAAIRCDLSEPGQVTGFVDEVRRRLGPVDVLVNNAGLIQVGPHESMTPEDFDEELRIHLWAPLHLVHAVLPDMRRRGGGRIVNISSIGGRIAVPHMLPYSVSKFALTGLSRGLHAELARDGVVVTTVCPGLVRTGSPPNALFKGRHQQEYAWFSVADSLPVLSVSAPYAARRILRAVEHGEAEVVVGPVAWWLVKLHDLAPGLAARVLALVDRLLPAPGGIGADTATGSDSDDLVPPWLTALTGRAARENNEFPRGAG